MALTSAEEALVRELIAQNPELLTLASNEATIISKLGAAKKNLAQLAAALSLSDTDLTFVRQGSTDKYVALSVLKAFAVAGVPVASDTVQGIVELATSAETQTGTDATRAVTPAGLSARTATTTLSGLVRLATTAEAQAFTANAIIDGAKLSDAFKGSNVSLASGGYQKLPSGLIVQWGVATVNAGTVTTVTRPVSFPTVTLTLIATASNSAATASQYATAYNISNSQHGISINTGTSLSVYWLAIGY